MDDYNNFECIMNNIATNFVPIKPQNLPDTKEAYDDFIIKCLAKAFTVMIYKNGKIEDIHNGIYDGPEDFHGIPDSCMTEINTDVCNRMYSLLKMLYDTPDNESVINSLFENTVNCFFSALNWNEPTFVDSFILDNTYIGKEYQVNTNVFPKGVGYATIITYNSKDDITVDISYPNPKKWNNDFYASGYSYCKDHSYFEYDHIIVEHVSYADLENRIIVVENEQLQKERKQYIGTIRQAKCGIKGTITKYNGNQLIEITYEDGTKLYPAILNSFLNNRFNPPCTQGFPVKQQTGGSAKLLHWRTCDDIDVKFSTGEIIEYVTFDDFKNGKLNKNKK